MSSDMWHQKKNCTSWTNKHSCIRVFKTDCICVCIISTIRKSVLPQTINSSLARRNYKNYMLTRYILQCLRNIFFASLAAAAAAAKLVDIFWRKVKSIIKLEAWALTECVRKIIFSHNPKGNYFQWNLEAFRRNSENISSDARARDRMEL